MQLSTRIAYNTIIQFIAKFVSTFLGLLAIAFIARYLGVKGYGEYTTAVTFISFFAIVADMGLTLVTVQLISQPEAKQEKILANLLALRLLSALVIIGLAPIFVLFFPYSEEIKQAVLAVSFSYFFIALNQVLVGLFQKQLRMDKVAIAEVASRALMLGLILLSIKFNYGIIGIMVAVSISSAFNFLLHYLFSLKFVRLRLDFDFAYWRKIAEKSWPLAVTIILNLLYLKTDTLLLSIIPRESELGIIEEVGLYGAAYKVIEVLITLPFMFAGIILPIITLKWAQKDSQGFANVLQKAFDVMAIVAVPLVFGTFVTSKKIMTMVAGKEFVLSASILNILIIASSVIFLGTMFSHAVIAINKQKKIIPAYLFVAASSVLLYFLVIPFFSYTGAAWITVYSEVAIAFFSFYITWKYTKFIPSLKVIGKSLVASLFMLGFIILLGHFDVHSVFAILPLAIAFYLVFMYAIKGLQREDILALLNRQE